MKQKSLLKALEKIEAFKTRDLKVEMASFEAVFEKYPTDFFCAEPVFFQRNSQNLKGIYMKIFYSSQ